jgi:hypothetical protein
MKMRSTATSRHSLFLVGPSNFTTASVLPPACTDQSINQSIDRSIDQLINQSINQSIKHSINQSVNQSINQFIDQSVSQTVNQTVSLLVDQVKSSQVKSVSKYRKMENSFI